MRKWLCLQCGWIYDEAEGDETVPIAPGTLWENLPQQWHCPECSAAQDQFEHVEIAG